MHACTSSTCKASKPHFNQTISVPLTTITQAIQEIEVLHKHRRTNWTVAQGRQAEAIVLRLYEHPEYEATFVATLEQRAEIAISLCRRF